MFETYSIRSKNLIAYRKPTRQTARKESDVFRNIHKKVHQRQRWNLLFASGSAWFVLWLVSAAIFRRTERNQSWSYFEALYFTFTSLMTIGYGDLYPTSNSGKAFFVFWSLLAVPILTILISSLGNTVIRTLRDIPQRLGRIQILHQKKKSRREATF